MLKCLHIMTWVRLLEGFARQSVSLNSLLATNPLTVHVPACIMYHFPKFTVGDFIYLAWTSFSWFLLFLNQERDRCSLHHKRDRNRDHRFFYFLSVCCKFVLDSVDVSHANESTRSFLFISVLCNLQIKKKQLNCMENGEYYIKRNFWVLQLNVVKLDVEVLMIWTWKWHNKMGSICIM